MTYLVFQEGKDASLQVFKVLNEAQDGNQSSWVDADEHIDISIRKYSCLQITSVNVTKEQVVCYNNMNEVSSRHK